MAKTDIVIDLDITTDDTANFSCDLEKLSLAFESILTCVQWKLNQFLVKSALFFLKMKQARNVLHQEEDKSV